MLRKDFNKMCKHVLEVKLENGIDKTRWLMEHMYSSFSCTKCGKLIGPNDWFIGEGWVEKPEKRGSNK